MAVYKPFPEAYCTRLALVVNSQAFAGTRKTDSFFKRLSGKALQPRVAPGDSFAIPEPGGVISASQWFSLMQIIFQELNAPLFSGGGERMKWQLKIWNVAEFYPPGPFETFKFDKSCSLLIATAIDLMERGELTPTGEGGQVFCGRE